MTRRRAPDLPDLPDLHDSHDEAADEPRRGGGTVRTLVLNAGYEPLAVVPLRRALVLVLAGKANVVVADEVPVASTTVTLPRPAVIVLNRYVRVPWTRAAPELTTAVDRLAGAWAGVASGQGGPGRAARVLVA